MCGWCQQDGFCGVKMECPNNFVRPISVYTCNDSITFLALITIPTLIVVWVFVVSPIMAAIVCCLRRQRKLQQDLRLAQHNYFELANER